MAPARADVILYAYETTLSHEAAREGPGTDSPDPGVFAMSPEAGAGGLKGRVLVVDDEASIRRLYVRWLSAIGFTSVEADGGKAAVDVFSTDTEGFDLVLLDMIMPDVSGFHTFELLREIDPEVRVVLCSGYRVDRQATIIMEAGAVGFLQKPFDREELLREIKRILGPTAGAPG